MPTLRSAIALTVIALASVTLFRVAGAHSATAVTLPPARLDEPRANIPASESIVFAGGCFWGVQAVFQHVNGVTSAISGYSGGDVNAPTYGLVSTGMTGHAESVKVTYDPSKVTLGRLLEVFFSVAHDPTTLNRSGPDRGTQYRSAVFAESDTQLGVVNAYVAQLDAAHVFPNPIVTQVSRLTGFYPAEDYHQNYATEHPYSPYIMINDAPKVTALKRQFSTLYREPI